MMSDVFERTWGSRAGDRPAEDYWPSLIPAVRSHHPEFRFLAEAYWDLEWALQQQGFDYCYDKKLYDRMEHGDAESVRLHLLADMAYQHGLVRFLENHDEPRAAATFAAEKARAAAVTLLTLPGAKLLHEGQFEGRRVRLPVFLSRRPDESPDQDLQAFYQRLLTETARDVFRNGRWRLCDRSGWPDNPSHLNIMAWCWELGDERYLVAVNFSGTPSQAVIRMPWEDLRGRTWRLSEAAVRRILRTSRRRDGRVRALRVPRAVAVARLPATVRLLIRRGHDRDCRRLRCQPILQNGLPDAAPATSTTHGRLNGRSGVKHVSKRPYCSLRNVAWSLVRGCLGLRLTTAPYATCPKCGETARISCCSNGLLARSALTDLGWLRGVAILIPA